MSLHIFAHFHALEGEETTVAAAVVEVPRAMLKSRTIGETENALRSILQRTLRGTGLDYHW